MSKVDLEDEIDERVEEAIEDDSNGYTSKKYLVSRATEKFLNNNVAIQEDE